MPEKLFIVISNLFGHELERTSLARTVEIAENVSLLSIDDRPIVLEGPISGDRLINVVVESIRSTPAASVVVLAHMGCVTDVGKSPGPSGQLRVLEVERRLSDALCAAGLTVPQHLEVHGFHHDDEGVPVWRVLSEFKIPVPPNFAQDLSVALMAVEQEVVFTRFSVLKHQIVGLFLPLDLTLQSWAETDDRQLRSKIESRLEERIAEAQKLLREVIVGLGRGNSAPLQHLLRLEVAQDAAAAAASFHAWLNKVDQALDDLRRETSA